MKNRTLKKQEGMVLFVALVFGLILAAVTVTTTQVVSFATKYSVVNDFSIRAYTQQISVANAINNQIDVMRQPNSNIIVDIYNLLDTDGLDNHFGGDLVCADPRNSSFTSFSYSPSNPSLTADITGFCGLETTVDSTTGNDIVDDQFDHINGSSGSPTYDYSEPTQWQAFDWGDDNCSTYSFSGRCYDSYVIGQDTDLETVATNIYSRSFGIAASSEEVRNYTGRALPRASVEIAKSSALNNAMASGGVSSPTTFYLRITSVGYGGYRRDGTGLTGRTRSTRMVSEVKEVYSLY